MKDSYRSTRRLDRLTLAHLIAATVGVTVVLLTMGLIIRSLGADDADASGMVKLMKVAPIDSASAVGGTTAAAMIDVSSTSSQTSQPVQSEQLDQTGQVVTLGFAAPPTSLAPAVAPSATAGVAENVSSDSRSSVATFNHRRLVKVRTITMTVTAYSPDAQSCGDSADGITASGYSVWTNGMKLVAADTSILPFGSVISVPGYNGGRPVPVLDRGGAIKGNHIDLLFPTNEAALQWGVKHLTITVWAYAD